MGFMWVSYFALFESKIQLTVQLHLPICRYLLNAGPNMQLTAGNGHPDAAISGT